MKCIICHNKFPKKHKQRCSKTPGNVCGKCSIEGKSVHSCDLDCAGVRFPKIESYPLTSGVIGNSPSGEDKTTTEEFMPRAFHLISCEVNYVNLNIKSLPRVECEVEFSLRGNKKLEKQIYSNEEWKLTHIESAFKKGETSLKHPSAPIFSIFLDGSMRIMPESIETTINNKRVPFYLNDTVELIGLPDCFPPLTDAPKPDDNKYSYFSGKFGVFYLPFVIGETYKIKFTIEAINFFYVTGFLFPYKYVSINRFSTDSNHPVIIPHKKLGLVNPIKDDIFPPKQEYEWDRHKKFDMRPPWMNRAEAFRNHPLDGLFDAPTIVEGNQDISFSKVKNYSIIYSRLYFALPKDKEFIANIETSKSPIPVRIYEQLQKLPRYRDFLISYDIINLKEEPLELELVSQIEGYSYKAIDNITVPPKGGAKSSRIVHTQCPKLKPGMLKKIVSATEANLTYKIYKKGGNKKTCLERDTRTIKFLPEDMIVWSIRDPKSSRYYDLAKMLGAWIVPTDEKRMLDKLRGAAKEYHPDKILIGYQPGNNSLGSATLQVKALYDYLNAKSKIRYVNQPFTTDFNSGGQRVLTPENVISSKSGNCIDLVVLFSSLMEGLGINPLLLLTKDHAFLGWGNKYSKDTMNFLECTCLGRINPETSKKFSFEEASQIGRQTYMEEFIKSGADDYIPLYSVIFGRDEPQIIDLQEIRNEGIYRHEKAK